MQLKKNNTTGLLGAPGLFDEADLPTKVGLSEEDNGSAYQPLAALLRPTKLVDFVGQTHLVGEGRPLHKLISNGQIHSLILWGPPGTGKTTLAHIISHECDCHFLEISAVTSGVKDIRAVIEQARLVRAQRKQKTLLFVDEVHRFNKSQQDAFLPVIEDGTIIFIGATTENPAFEINNALLSRARTYVLEALSEPDLKKLLNRATNAYLPTTKVSLEDNAQSILIANANGDARNLLNLFEICVDFCRGNAQGADDKIALSVDVLKKILPKNIALYDKGGDAFYDLISAFHKTVRGSDPDAALYWYCRILEGGGEPLYIARRLLAIASEDVGNADPRALEIALNAWDTFHRVGPAEGERAIAQATVYLALAPKSNAVYSAFKKARACAQETAHEPVPFHLRNSTSDITKDLGHGREYRYAHDEPNAFAAGEDYFPENVTPQRFYYPSERGLEKKLAEKRAYLDQANAMATRLRRSKS